MKKISLIFTAFLGIFLFSNCEQIVEIDLPDYESELVVEGYLNPGLAYVVSVTESVPYFDEISLPVVNDAIVTIEHRGEIDTLTLFQTDSLGVYVNLQVGAPLDDFDPFTLRVSHPPTGREVTATTRFVPPVPIDTVTYMLNDSAKASVVMYFTDDASQANHYKVLFGPKEQVSGLADTINFRDIHTWQFTDQVFSGQQIISGTGFVFDTDTEITARLVTIDQQYYDYLESVEDAENAGDGPFARPTRIVSAVEGGIGVFTALSYSDVVVKIEE